jgi:chromosome partitioning protein
MIILIGSQKGGTGKSTTAVNMCAWLAKKGHDVMLVDSDRQSTAANWVSDREERADVPQVHCVQKYDNIRETLNDLKRRYEYVIVDAAGRDSKELRTGMTAADVLIIPFRPSQPDLDTLTKMVELIDQAKDFNPDMLVYGLITMAPTNPVINETQVTRKYLEEYPEVKLLKTIIRDRKIYRDAISEGLGVVEMNNDKAKAEIQLLVNEVLQW